MATNTRQRILAATEDLLRTRGVARLTTKDIAKAAGLAEGTLFNHFARKDDLVLAVILERAPKFLLTIPEAGTKTVERNLIKVAGGVIAFYDDVLPVILSVFADAELLARHHEAVDLRKGGPQHMIRAIAHYLENEQALGRINAAIEPSIAAFALMAPCFQWVFSKRSTGMSIFPDMSAKTFAQRLVAIQITGLGVNHDRAAPAISRKVASSSRKNTAVKTRAAKAATATQGVSAAAKKTKTSRPKR